MLLNLKRSVAQKSSVISSASTASTTDDTVRLNLFYCLCDSPKDLFSRDHQSYSENGVCIVYNWYVHTTPGTVFALNSNFSSVSIPPAHQKGTLNPAVASVVGYCATIDGGYQSKELIGHGMQRGQGIAV